MDLGYWKHRFIDAILLAIVSFALLGASGAGWHDTSVLYHDLVIEEKGVFELGVSSLGRRRMKLWNFLNPRHNQLRRKGVARRPKSVKRTSYK